MTTIRRRLTLWYTVALAVTVLAFGTALVPRAAAVRHQGAGPAHQPRSATSRIAGSLNRTRCSGRIVTTAGLSAALDPGISAYLESVRDYLIVADTAGQLLALSDSDPAARRAEHWRR